MQEESLYRQEELFYRFYRHYYHQDDNGEEFVSANSDSSFSDSSSSSSSSASTFNPDKDCAWCFEPYNDDKNFSPCNCVSTKVHRKCIHRSGLSRCAVCGLKYNFTRGRCCVCYMRLDEEGEQVQKVCDCRKAVIHRECLSERNKCEFCGYVFSVPRTPLTAFACLWYLLFALLNLGIAFCCICVIGGRTFGNFIQGRPFSGFPRQQKGPAGFLLFPDVPNMLLPELGYLSLLFGLLLVCVYLFIQWLFGYIKNERGDKRQWIFLKTIQCWTVVVIISALLHACGNLFYTILCDTFVLNEEVCDTIPRFDIYTFVAGTLFPFVFIGIPVLFGVCVCACRREVN